MRLRVIEQVDELLRGWIVASAFDSESSLSYRWQEARRYEPLGDVRIQTQPV
jgi:hypothetical protein